MKEIWLDDPGLAKPPPSWQPNALPEVIDYSGLFVLEHLWYFSFSGSPFLAYKPCSC